MGKQRIVMLFPYRLNNQRQTNVIAFFNLKIFGQTHYLWRLQGGDTLKCNLALRNDYAEITPFKLHIFALCMYSLTSANYWKIPFWLCFSFPSPAEPNTVMVINTDLPWITHLNPWSTSTLESPKDKKVNREIHSPSEWLLRVSLEKQLSGRNVWKNLFNNLC